MKRDKETLKAPKRRGKIKGMMLTIKTGKRKRKDCDLGAEENMNMNMSNKEPSVDSGVEEDSFNSAKAEKKKRKKKPSEDSGKKEKKKKRTEDSEAGEKSNDAKKNQKKASKSAGEEEEEDQDAEKNKLVRGKRFTKEEDALVKSAVLEYIDNHALGDEGLKMVLECKSYPQVKGCWNEIVSALPRRPK